MIHNFKLNGAKLKRISNILLYNNFNKSILCLSISLAQTSHCNKPQKLKVKKYLWNNHL